MMSKAGREKSICENGQCFAHSFLVLRSPSSFIEMKPARSMVFPIGGGTMDFIIALSVAALVRVAFRAADAADKTRSQFKM